MKLCYSASKGIYFSCTGCSRCCSADQEGFVFVYWEDIINMKKSLNIPLEEIAKKFLMITQYDYTIWDQNLEDTGETNNLDTLVLNYEKKSKCLFLSKENGRNICTIYLHRPYQCQLYPFWNLIMESEIEFQSHKSVCPGFSEQTKFHSKEEIQNLLTSERQIERNFTLAMKNQDNNIYKMYPFLKK